MNTLFLYSKEDCLFDLELLHVKFFSFKKKKKKQLHQQAVWGVDETKLFLTAIELLNNAMLELH